MIIPGHSSTAEPNGVSPRTDGKPDGSTGPINPTLNSTYDFLAKFYGEIKTVFPDKFVHVVSVALLRTPLPQHTHPPPPFWLSHRFPVVQGGDEVSFDCWQSNPQISAWMKHHPEIKDYAALEQYYELRLLDILKQQNTSYIW